MSELASESGQRFVSWLADKPNSSRLESEAEADYGIFVAARELRPGTRAELRIKGKVVGDRSVVTIVAINPTDQKNNPQVLTDNPKLPSIGGGTVARSLPPLS